MLRGGGVLASSGGRVYYRLWLGVGICRLRVSGVLGCSRSLGDDGLGPSGLGNG